MEENEEEEKTPIQQDNKLVSDNEDDQPQQTHRHTRDLSQIIEGWKNLLRRVNELEDDAIEVLGLPPTKITSEGLDSKDRRCLYVGNLFHSIGLQSVPGSCSQEQWCQRTTY